MAKRLFYWEHNAVFAHSHLDACFEIPPVSPPPDHQLATHGRAQRAAVAGALDAGRGDVGVFSGDWLVGF